MTTTDVPDLFKACDGLRFRSGGERFALIGGRYHTGNGAIQIFTAAAPDEFWVRFETKESSRAPQALLDLGLFEETEVIAGQGFEPRYACRERAM